MFLRRWQGTPLQWQLHILYKSFKFCKLAFLVYSVTPKPLSMNCMLLMPPESSAGSYFALHSGICWQNGNDEKNSVLNMLSSSQKPRCWKHVAMKQCRATTHTVWRRKKAWWLMGFFFFTVVHRQHILLIPHILHFWLIAWLRHKISSIQITNIWLFVIFLLGC